MTNKNNRGIIGARNPRKEDLHMDPDDIVECEECGTEIRVEDCYTAVYG